MGWSRKRILQQLMQKLFDDNDGLIYLTYNESKSVVSEKLLRTLKGKIYK